MLLGENNQLHHRSHRLVILDWCGNIHDNKRKKKMMEKVFEGELPKALAEAALGEPHFIITQSGDEVLVDATNGFDMDNLFNVLKHMARIDGRFKKALVDYVIELSKEC